MIYKTLFDYIVAIIGLIILFPLLILISIGIKLTMGNGNIIFSQKRVGKNGEIFTIHKFRTMVNVHHGSSISIAGENRITKLGSFLRKYKLDELPELFDIICGKMSFVGPRPDVPGYADKLENHESLILKIKPGITGLASLKYRDEEEILSRVDNPIEYNNEIIFPDKIKINLYYIKNWSFLLDIQIIVYTIFGLPYNKLIKDEGNEK